MALLWLYCRAWGAHGNHILSIHRLWKFIRDDLREVLFDLSYPDPDEVPVSNDLMNLLKAKLETEKKDLADWSNSIYKASIEIIPKREFSKCYYLQLLFISENPNLSFIIHNLLFRVRPAASERERPF